MKRRQISNRVIAGAVRASFLILMGLGLGCDKSPTAPAAVPLAVTAITPARGLTGDTVMIAGTGFLRGATLTLDGLAARVISATSTIITVITPAHASGTAEVVVTNPGGDSAKLTGGYTFEAVSLTVSPTVVASGGRLTTGWVAPGGRSCNGGGDWIAIYRVGDPDITGAANGHSDLWFDHVCGVASGMFTLSAPNQPGQYEFRYLVGDTAVARSSPVTISAPASRLIPGLVARER